MPICVCLCISKDKTEKALPNHFPDISNMFVFLICIAEQSGLW